MRGSTRREAIAAATSAIPLLRAGAKTPFRLNRKKIVDRHSPIVTSVDIRSALQVGKGEFAFGMDVTGLQTHAAHFVLWGRPDLIERSLPWYKKILPRAQERARQQGYRGARWPKEVGPDGRETPGGIGPFLSWQQPHPIYYSELLYRLRRTRETLETYRQVVFETAEFMAAYASWDDSLQKYLLGPPLIPAQESYASIRTRLINPTFELAYWQWGLLVAQNWRERLGMQRDPAWGKVLTGLSPAPIRDGVYTAIAVEPYTLYNDDPSMLCALGCLRRLR